MTKSITHFMQTSINRIQQSAVAHTRWALTFIAIAVGIQIQYIHYGWINPDSVLYFESARLINLGEWQAATKVFPWPFYAFLIACLNSISTLFAFTTLTIHQSAIVLNVLLFGLASYSFFKLIELAGGKSMQLVSGALILVSSQYLVGDVLSMLMRDEGFWAFYLASLIFFIRFYKHHHIADALLWQISIMLATLFRIEAITYLVLLPILLLLGSATPFSLRVKHYLQANLLNIAALLVILGAILISDQLSIKNFGRLQEIFSLNVLDELTKQLFARADIMRDQVLGKFLEEYAVPGLLLTFVYVMIAKILSASGLVTSGLALFSLRNKSISPEASARIVFTGVLAITLMNMALIITKVFVLSGRYVLAMVWIVMIFAAFQLAMLLESFNSAKKTQQWLVIAILVFMSLSLLKNVLPKRDGYDYEHEAIVWLQQHNKAHKPVFYDDSKLMYFANAPYQGNWQNNEAVIKTAINDKTIFQHEYLAVTQSLKYPEKFALITTALPEYQEIKRFSDAKKKKFVVIYQRTPSQ